MKIFQIVINIALYAFLLWEVYHAFLVGWDPWYGVTVGFVLVLAIIIMLMPGLHAPRTSPGEYPFDD